MTNAHVVSAKPNTTVKVTIVTLYNYSYITGINIACVLSEIFIQSISQVRLYDGSTYNGIVEDFDVHSDLATVRINKVVNNKIFT